MKNILLFFGLLLLIACNKDKTAGKTVKDPALVGTWRMDSVINLPGTPSVYKDTIYYGDPPNKRLLMFVKDDNTFTFEYVGRGISGNGTYLLTKPEYGYMEIKAQSYLPYYPLTVYLMVYHFMDVMNNATLYSIQGNQLSVLNSQSNIAKFTKEE